jgi:hypothetical protein
VSRQITFPPAGPILLHHFPLTLGDPPVTTDLYTHSYLKYGNDQFALQVFQRLVEQVFECVYTCVCVCVRVYACVCECVLVKSSSLSKYN